jgi:hypothetical protein
MLGQVITILIVYFLLSIALLISAGFNVPVIVSIFIQSLWMILLIYDTKCLVEGNCNTWAWVRTILMLLIPAILIILMTAKAGGAFSTVESYMKSTDEDDRARQRR